MSYTALLKRDDDVIVAVDYFCRSNMLISKKKGSLCSTTKGVNVGGYYVDNK